MQGIAAFELPLSSKEIAPVGTSDVPACASLVVVRHLRQYSHAKRIETQLTVKLVINSCRAGRRAYPMGYNASMEVRFHYIARREFNAILPPAEKDALAHVIEMLEENGERLGHPYTSAMRIAANLRELRPRAGRSTWRAFYRRIGDVMFVGAFGPEAQSNRRDFERAVRAAEARLDDVEKGTER
jgi:hypothetical protein